MVEGPFGLSARTPEGMGHGRMRVALNLVGMTSRAGIRGKGNGKEGWQRQEQADQEALP